MMIPLKIRPKIVSLADIRPITEVNKNDISFNTQKRKELEAGKSLNLNI